ncbi:phosphonoacetaldehyde hydrolase, partial [Acinetobacter baumannii]
VGLSYAEWSALSTDEQIVLKDKASQKMNASGAHYVIDSVADLPNVLDDIERRLGQGERP